MLIFIPCSDKKRAGGKAIYDAGSAIYSILPNELGDRILACRASWQRSSPYQ
jgi:hypothetical protein